MSIIGNSEGSDTLDDQEMMTQRNAYYGALYARWGILDFRGITHVNMYRPISIPLEDVFVLPDLLAGPLPVGYATLKREDRSDRAVQTAVRRGKQQGATRDVTRAARDQQQATINNMPTRTNFQVALKEHKKLLILGDPGSGKTTLLRYLLLQVMRGENSALQALLGDIPFVPCYVPLTAYAEICRYQQISALPLDNFLPLYLKEFYLDIFTDFLQEALARKQVFFLFDGLDEVADIDMRRMIVSEIEYFAKDHEDNYFIVTSRIVGYKDAPFSPTSGYQEYTLADFTPKQIDKFIDQWCLAYERLVQGKEDSPQIKSDAQKETKKLFLATQRNEGVKRLATNPLLLTILALIQRQGIILPEHRVELFDLCATTLLDTRLTAKGYPQASRMTRNNLVKLLRPLAFWMHQQSDVNMITRKQLVQNISKQLKNRNIKIDNSPTEEIIEYVLDILCNKTGILVEKGKDQFGFLHLTFGEYFAAGELVVRRERETLIKQYLHIPHWREVILLTTGIIGIQQSDEDGVTALVQRAILKANSPYEQWLRRDLLFAGLCVADDVRMSVACEDAILEQIVYLFLTSPYASLSKACESVLSTWHGTRIAREAERLLIPLLERQILSRTNTAAMADPSSRASLFERRILAHYQQLIYDQQTALVNVFRLQLRVILHRLQVSMEDDYIEDALSLLSNSSRKVRQIAVTSLAQLGVNEPEVRSALCTALSDPHAEVRRTAALALEHLGGGDTGITEALLAALADPTFTVRQAAAMTLGHVGSSNALVLYTLCRVLSDPDDDVKRAAAVALGHLAPNDLPILETLLSLLSGAGVESSIREAAAIALGRLGKGDARVRTALLAVVTEKTIDDSVRQAAATSLGYLGRDDAAILISLLDLQSKSDASIRCATITALGYLNSSDHHIQNALLSALSDEDACVRQNATSVLGKLKIADRSILRRLQDIAKDDVDPYVQKAAATSLSNLRPRLPQELGRILLRALWQSILPAAADKLSIEFLCLEEPDARVRESAVTLLARRGNPQIINTLLKVLSDDRDPFVKQAAITVLAETNIKDAQLLERLQKELLAILADLDADPDIRKAATTAIEQLCSKHTHLKPTDSLMALLLEPSIKALTDQWTHESIARYAQKIYNEALLRNVTLLGLIGSSEPNQQMIKMLLTILREGEDVDLRNCTIVALSKLGIDHQDITQAIIRALSDQDTEDAAVRALAHLSQLHSQVRDEMIHSLSTPNYLNKRAIIEAFGQSNHADAQVIKALLTLLTLPDTPDEQAQSYTFDRQEAARTLGKIAWEDSAAITTLIKTLADEDVSVRAEVATALGQIGYISQEKPKIIDALILALDTSNPSVRLAAISALRHIDHRTPELVQALLKLYKDNDLDARVQRAVVAALAHLGNNDAEVIQTLCDALLHGAPHIRREIATAFSRSDNHVVIQALLVALADPDPTVQREVVSSLGTMRSKQVKIRSALQETFSKADTSVRKAVVTALGKLGDGESLLDALDDPDMTVRREAAFALVQQQKNYSVALPTLLGFLLDPTESIRQKAVTALGKYGNDRPEVLHALLRSLSDEDPFVREEVAAVLATMPKEQMENICTLIVEKLQRYAPIANQQFIADGNQTIDATLFALQRAVGNRLR
jgi:HEAT repeat protein